jgi:prepilin-type N-terminal cleavage/methylation domain-containing protein
MIGEVTVGRKGTDTTQAGFSLIELVIALTVTLIISGAVYQLMTAGQTAFRKEPAMADRQQSIRLGMDLISQDIFKAGYGFPQFAQVFTDSLDAVGPMGSGGAATDELEIFLANECGAKQVCDSPGTTITTRQQFQACDNFPALVILGNPTEWGVYWAEAPGVGTSASCDGSGKTRNGHAVLPHGKARFANPPGGVPFDPEWMIVGSVIRYRIALEADGTPNLERSAYGGDDLNGNSTWEIIARGVEDLQVEYLNGLGWQDEPGTVSCFDCDNPVQADFDTLIRRVRVRLSARALAPNLTGQTMSAVGNAPRGQLVTEVAPRAAAATLGGQAGEM